MLRRERCQRCFGGRAARLGRAEAWENGGDKNGAKGHQQPRQGAAGWSFGQEAAGVAERREHEAVGTVRSGQCGRGVRTRPLRAVRALGAGAAAQGGVRAGCPEEEGALGEQRGGGKPGLLHSAQENGPDPGAKWRQSQGIASEGLEVMTGSWQPEGH